MRQGDFVISLRSFEGGIEFSQFDGCVSPAYTVLAPVAAADPRFLRHLLKSAPFVSALQSQTDSLRDGKAIGFEQLSRVRLPLPRTDEQRAIARFLDYETARIDALIAKQERLIELLKEKRQAVISHAVTKGLNPDAPVKDSGVEWLGAVPAHWDVLPVKRVVTSVTSGPRGWSEHIVDDGDAAFIQSGDLGSRGVVEADKANRINSESSVEAARALLQQGDLLVCITGAKTGNAAVFVGCDRPAYLNQHLARLRPMAEKANAKFLLAVLTSSPGQAHFTLSQYGLKQGLGLEQIENVAVAFPPMAEQLDIVAYLDDQESIFERLVRASDEQVALLRERRTALISAAVTGKIDVRNWQPAEEQAA